MRYLQAALIIGAASVFVCSFPASAQGVPAIIGVHANSEVSAFNLQRDSPPAVEFWTDTLFSDGTSCRDCFNQVALSMAGFHALKRARPSAFGKWIKIGNKHKVVYGGGEDANLYDADMLLSPAAKGTKLSIVLANLAGDPSGFASKSFGHIRFANDGRFGVYSNPRTILEHGHYSLEGYRLSFSFAGGRMATVSFAWNPKQKGFLLINGTSFYQDRETDARLASAKTEFGSLDESGMFPLRDSRNAAKGAGTVTVSSTPEAIFVRALLGRMKSNAALPSFKYPSATEGSTVPRWIIWDVVGYRNSRIAFAQTLPRLFGPNTGKVIAGLVASDDDFALSRAISRDMAAHGLSDASVIDAIAYFWVRHSLKRSQSTYQPSPQVFQAVRAQIYAADQAVPEMLDNLSLDEQRELGWRLQYLGFLMTFIAPQNSAAPELKGLMEMQLNFLPPLSTGATLGEQGFRF